jgi:hypothetical protein
MARKIPIAIVLSGRAAPSFEAELTPIDMTKVERMPFDIVRVHGVAMPGKIFAKLKFRSTAVDCTLEWLVVALFVPAAGEGLDTRLAHGIKS